MEGSVIDFCRSVSMVPTDVTNPVGGLTLNSVVSFLQPSLPSTCVVAASDCLASVSKASPACADVVLHCGAISALVDVAGSNTDPSARAAIFGALLNTLANAPGASDEFAHCRGLRVVSSALSDGLSEPGKGVACRLVQAFVASHPESEGYVIKAGIIRPISRIVATAANDLTASYACLALANIAAGSDAVRSSMCGEGTVAHAMAAVQRATSSKLKAAACKLIANLCCDEEARAQTVAANGVDYLVQIGQADGAPWESISAACSALRNLCADNGARQLVAKQGGSKMCIDVLRDSSNLQSEQPKLAAIYASGALRNMAQCSDASVARRMYQEGALSQLIRIVREARPADYMLLGAACAAIGNIAQADDALRLKISESRAIRPLLHLCESSSMPPYVKAGSASALKSICLNGRCRLKLSDLGGLPILTELLKGDNESVVLEAVYALRNATLSTVNRNYVTDCGGPRALAHVLHKNPSEAVVAGAAWAIASIAESDQARPKLGDAGIPRALVHATERCTMQPTLEGLVSAMLVLCEDGKVASQLSKCGGRAAASRIDQVGNSASRRLAKVLQGRFRQFM